MHIMQQNYLKRKEESDGHRNQNDQNLRGRRQKNGGGRGAEIRLSVGYREGPSLCFGFNSSYYTRKKEREVRGRGVESTIH